jgi:hypothetical protein
MSDLAVHLTYHSTGIELLTSTTHAIDTQDGEAEVSLVRAEASFESNERAPNEIFHSENLIELDIAKAAQSINVALDPRRLWAILKQRSANTQSCEAIKYKIPKLSKRSLVEALYLVRVHFQLQRGVHGSIELLTMSFTIKRRDLV